jgi:hypothetical protein
MTVDSGFPEPLQPAFFSGQRLTAADLTAAETYHREMRWLHSRTLHAWGISLGLLAGGARGAKEVRVEPGYALDDLGRDLVLTEPAVVPVPPVSGDDAGAAARFYLTISYVEDADARTIERATGACSGEGAVRVAERSALRWQPVPGVGGGKTGTGSIGDYQVGRDVVLASAMVRHCRLDEPLSLAERREVRPSTQPYVAGGGTPDGATPWYTWTRDDQVVGLWTPVDTSSGRFASTPNYFAQLHGFRAQWASTTVFYEGWVQVDDPAPDRFTFRLFMPEHSFDDGDPATDDWHLNPHETLVDPKALEKLSNELRWRVAWLGVEG